MNVKFFVYNILFLSVGGEGARLVEAADAHLVYCISYYTTFFVYNILPCPSEERVSHLLRAYIVILYSYILILYYINILYYIILLEILQPLLPLHPSSLLPSSSLPPYLPPYPPIPPPSLALAFPLPLALVLSLLLLLSQSRKRGRARAREDERQREVLDRRTDRGAHAHAGAFSRRCAACEKLRARARA